MVRRAVATVDGTTVELGQSANTDVLAEVDVAGDGGGTDVVPVGVVRSELLAGAGLDKVDPDGDLEFACTVRKGQETALVACRRGDILQKLHRRRSCPLRTDAPRPIPILHHAHSYPAALSIPRPIVTREDDSLVPASRRSPGGNRPTSGRGRNKLQRRGSRCPCKSMTHHDG